MENPTTKTIIYATAGLAVVTITLAGIYYTYPNWKKKRSTPEQKQLESEKENPSVVASETES